MEEIPLPGAVVPETLMDIEEDEFLLLRDLIHRNFGIHLGETKRALLVRRLQQWLTNNGFRCFRDYYRHLSEDGDDQSFAELANRITTNYTFFNREPEHFSFFRTAVLPELARVHAGKRNLNLWSAGVSTGEEAYMLAMCLMDFFGRDYPLWRTSMLATDISKRALERAEHGLYHEKQVHKLPDQVREAYFDSGEGNQYRVKPIVRREVTFKRLNLHLADYGLGQFFDVIFCRNVMIYFDQGVKEQVTAKLHQCLRPGGYLFIGHSESLAGNRKKWESMGPSIFRKRS